MYPLLDRALGVSLNVDDANPQNMYSAFLVSALTQESPKIVMFTNLVWPNLLDLRLPC